MTFALPSGTVPGWRLLREADDRGDERPDRQPDDDEATRTERAVVCRTCRTEVGDPAAIFTMNPGRPGDVFMNPHGYLHEILTLRTARNVLPLGAPTTEFTWFPGYAWQIAFCAGCRDHLGWLFTATEARELQSFWGFRRHAVVVDESE